MDVGSERDIKKTEKVIKDTFEITHLNEILQSAEDFIGTMEFVNDTLFVYDKDNGELVKKDIKYVPGLYKIFDELLINVASNKLWDPSMDSMKIEFNSEENTITVFNNGKGLPIVVDEKEKMYLPTVLYSRLVNYDKDKLPNSKRCYGVKICNIFSSKFIAETASTRYKKSFTQTWTNNMSLVSEPVIEDVDGQDYTKVTLTPDLARFGMESLDSDTISLLSRRAYDIAACMPELKVHLNGVEVPIGSLKEYAELCIKGKHSPISPSKYTIECEQCGPRWEIGVTFSNEGFQQVSFVNGIATPNGGAHVDYVVEILVEKLEEELKKTKHEIDDEIKEGLWVFINSWIDSPVFDSPVRQRLLAPPDDLQEKMRRMMRENEYMPLGSKCTFSETFITNIAKNIIDSKNT